MGSTICGRGYKDDDQLHPEGKDHRSKEVSPSPTPSSMPASASSSSPQNKRQRCEVVPCETVKAVGGDPDLNEITSGSTVNYKNKQIATYNMDGREQVAFSNNVIGSSTSSYSKDAMEDSEIEMQDSDYSDHDVDDDCLGDYDEYEDNDDTLSDHSFDLSAKFDYMDIPPGVEANVPWLKDSEPTKPNVRKPYQQIVDETDKKFKLFKQFDTVEDYSDHHYANNNTGTPTKDWAKRIQHEWKLLENDLPDSIFVRVYENRMDLLRAAIVGPAGTPYHDGLFFFDVRFPPEYPHHPPKVHYHSGGLRLNPNLYSCGKVCLSLLGTWSGKGCENWSSSKSSMLQVLISIQALVLNDNPYFNEPGYERIANTNDGKKKAMAYNKDTFVLSCRTMLYSLRRPPKHFEDFIAGHFCKQGNTILAACKAYMDGVQIGSVIKEDEDEDEDEKQQDAGGSKLRDPKFTSDLKKLFEDLLMEFTVKGADCDKFLAQKIKAGKAKVNT